MSRNEITRLSLRKTRSENRGKTQVGLSSSCKNSRYVTDWLDCDVRHSVDKAWKTDAKTGKRLSIDRIDRIGR